MKVGVLALQGDFREHLQTLVRLGIEGIGIRSVGDLDKVEGLIVPGGESTTISLLMEKSGLGPEIRRRGREGLPIFGTCTGMIVLAKQVIDYPYRPLGLIDIAVKRNGYGRQVDSFEADLNITGIGPFHAIFIRAPIMERVGSRVEVLASFLNKPVMAREGNILVSSFHPELTEDLRIHEYFLNMIAEA